MIQSKQVRNYLLLGITSGLFLTAFAVSFMRTEATLIGYRLGELKKEESVLLKELSTLKTRVAKLKTKESLEYLANNNESRTEKQNLAAIVHNR